MSRRKKNNPSMGIIVLVVAFMCAMCCIGIIFINLMDINPILSNSASTPPPAIPLPTIIAQTASAAQAQTLTASSPIPLSSPTPTEALTSTTPMETTATVFIFDLQTNVAQPTEYIYATNTPFTLVTQPPSTPSGNCNSSYPDVCINDNPRLSCEELRAIGISHFRVLPPDPLGYDKDKDGIGCE